MCGGRCDQIRTQRFTLQMAFGLTQRGAPHVESLFEFWFKFDSECHQSKFQPAAIGDRFLCGAGDIRDAKPKQKLLVTAG